LALLIVRWTNAEIAALVDLGIAGRARPLRSAEGAEWVNEPVHTVVVGRLMPRLDCQNCDLVLLTSWPSILL
jgi:hypothetical protein